MSWRERMGMDSPEEHHRRRLREMNDWLLWAREMADEWGWYGDYARTYWELWDR